MKIKLPLLLLSVLIFSIFVAFSYSVAKESWQRIDFDATVKLQDRIPRDFDEIFSFFSLLGSVEITVGVAVILSILALVRLKIWTALSWLLILPASIFEVFGKLVLFHPGPPVLFHRSIIETYLPSFYVHTNFSYPSGHMTRTVFLITIFLLVVLFNRMNIFYKAILLGVLLSFGFLMALTRVYLGEHWLSDVIGGGLLGSSAGLFASIFIIKFKK